jgi:parallel beta-helix repeat protein
MNKRILIMGISALVFLVIFNSLCFSEEQKGKNDENNDNKQDSDNDGHLDYEDAFPFNSNLWNNQFYSNITLRLKESPFIIREDIYFFKGATLTIESGVEIKLINYAAIIINGGVLNARGTNEKTIKFTTGNNPPSKSLWDWGGIRIVNNDNSVIEYALIEYSEVGIRIVNASPIISYCNFSCIKDYGIWITENSSPVISNCTISGIKKHGIWVEESSNPLIIFNLITNCSRDIGTHSGIDVYFTSSATIKYNKIFDNGLWEISCNSNSTIISYNTILINKWGKTIVNSGDDNILNAEYNYWGTTNMDEIKSSIGGDVDFNPWLDYPLV